MTGSRMSDAPPPTHSAGRILVVEDERALAQMVSLYLRRAGFEVTEVHDGAVAVTVAEQVRPDVVILDLGLPGLDGLEVCRRLRSFSTCYILMLTARGAEEDRITGLSIGADDYITKPFSIRELVTRVHAVMRRPRMEPAVDPREQSPEFAALHLDPGAHEVRVDGHTISLTRTEFDLLCTLISAPSRVLSRRELVTTVWDTTWVGDERVVDVHIGNLRRKLDEAAPGRDFIDTVRGIGYRMARP